MCEGRGGGVAGWWGLVWLVVWLCWGDEVVGADDFDVLFQLAVFVPVFYLY